MTLCRSTIVYSSIVVASARSRDACGGELAIQRSESLLPTASHQYGDYDASQGTKQSSRNYFIMLLLGYKGYFWSFFFEHGNVLVRQVTSEPTQCWSVSYELDEHGLSYWYRFIVINMSASPC